MRDHAILDEQPRGMAWLPDFSHNWLLDAEDQRYTSELRIVAVDLSRRTDDHRGRDQLGGGPWSLEA